MLRIVEKLSLLPVALASLALFAMMVMTFADVVLRSVLNAPIEAATELTRIFMAIIVFTVLPVVSARGEHISVDLMDPLFGPLAARLRDGLMALICGGMLYLPAERIAVLAERARSYGDVTEYMGFPQFYPAWGIAIFTYVTMVALIVRGLYILIVGHPARD